MLLEIIAQNREDAVIAEEYGADRLELVTAISEGGLTPSYGVIKEVVKSVSIPVHVMVRPHSYSFVYTREDHLVIKEDVLAIKELGAAGIVFGSLTKEGQIDEEFLQKVIQYADGMKITFHRAIDEAKDTLGAFETLQKYASSVQTILTSGGKPTVLEGIPTLQEMTDKSAAALSPVIMPGSGLSANNIESIHNQLHASEYHFGSAVRVNGKFSEPIDGTIIERIRSLVEVR